MKMNEDQNSLEPFLHNVKWLRQKHKLSKKEMAKIMDVSIPTLNKIENGIVPPRLTVEVLFRLWDHFAIRPGDLVGRRLGEC